jgi:type IV secretion system protein TrbL
MVNAVKFLFSKFCLLAFCLVPITGFGQVAILDEMLSEYEAFGSQAYAAVFPYAASLFWGLALLELTWGSINFTLEGDSLQSFAAFVAKKVLLIGFFWYVVSNAGYLLDTIIDSFELVGAAAGGIAPASLAPTYIAGLGVDALSSILGSLGTWGALANPGTAFFAALAAFAILVSMVIVAAHVLITKIEAALVMGVSVLMLAFSVLQFSRDFMGKVIGYAFSVGIRLMMLYFVLGIGMQKAILWTAELKKVFITGQYEAALTLMADIAAGSIVFCLIAWIVPRLAAALLSGGVQLSASDLTSAVRNGVSGAMTAIGMTGAMLGQAIERVAGGASGGSSSGIDKAAQAHIGGASSKGALGSPAMGLLGNAITGGGSNMAESTSAGAGSASSAGASSASSMESESASGGTSSAGADEGGDSKDSKGSATGSVGSGGYVSKGATAGHGSSASKGSTSAGGTSTAGSGTRASSPSLDTPGQDLDGDDGVSKNPSQPRRRRRSMMPRHPRLISDRGGSEAVDFHIPK